MTDIVLCTANARYHHSAFGARCLLANLGELADRARIVEGTTQDRAIDIAERVLSHRPRIVGLSVYIWNVALLTDVAAILRAVRPDMEIVLGGPEVSFGVEGMPIAESADFIVAGEGEEAFADLCERLLKGAGAPPRDICAPPLDLERVALPYAHYSDHDIAHRTVYVETSRGCPFGCEFCLSCLDRKVRRFPIDAVMGGIDGLFSRGARSFKFIDRALHLTDWRRVLGYFEARKEDGIFLHFEVVPDRISDELIEALGAFLPGSIQLEAGVQTFDAQVASRIGRRQDPSRIERNISALRERTGVHLHTDLVFGLPGETLESMAQGFDRLMSLGVQEIQLGILKKLRGAPIARHDGPFEMVYSPVAPYEILRNRDVSFEEMQGLKRLARYFDLVHNGGRFSGYLELLGGKEVSPWRVFTDLSQHLHRETGKTAGIALKRLIELLFDYGVEKGFKEQILADRLYADAAGHSRRGFPQRVLEWVSPDLAGGASAPSVRAEAGAVPVRQRRRV